MEQSTANFFITAICAGVVIIVLAGCGPAQNDHNQYQAVDACLEQGGIPLTSVFDTSVLRDCQFKN